MSIRRNFTYTFGRQVLTAIAQLLLVILIARALGPEGNGQYAMALLFPSLLVSFLNLGVGPATVYHISRGDFSSKQAFRGNISIALRVIAGGMLIFLPMVFLFGNQIFPGIPLLLLLLGLAVFPVSLLSSYLNSILQGLENFRAYNWAVLLPPYLNLACVIGVLYILNGGIAETIISCLVSQIAGLVLLGMFLRREVQSLRSNEGEATDVSYKRKTLGFGWKAHLSNILAFVNYRADIFLVNLLLNPAATGLYVIAVRIAESLWMPSQAASTVLFPRMSAMHNNPEERLRLTRVGFISVAAFTSGAAVCAAIALYWLMIPVFGEQYIDSLPAFLWLLPGIIAGSGARVQANCIAAAGKPEWNLYVACGVVTLNIMGNLFLIPEYGIMGAACATSIAYIANSITKWYLMGKLGRL